MEIYNETQGGWPSQVDSIMRRRVSDYTSGNDFKIGITNDPDARAGQYGYIEPYPYYDEMILIYETSSIINARKLESELIKHYGALCDNRIGGGGGSSESGRYYLYIVRAL